MEIELVRVFDLAKGDRILLDSGEEITVRGADNEGCHKDMMRILLKGRPPLYVNSYFLPFTRRTFKNPRTALSAPEVR